MKKIYEFQIIQLNGVIQSKNKQINLLENNNKKILEIIDEVKMNLGQNKDKIQNMEKEIKIKENNIKNLNSEINTLKSNNFQLTKEKNDLNNEKLINASQIDQLKRAINTQSEQIAILKNDNKKFLEIIDENRKVINTIKMNLPFELKENEKLMTIIINSSDQNIMNYPIICKDKLIFNAIENLLYEKFPQYKEGNNIFLVNGNMVNKSKSLEENNIRNRQIILMQVNFN